MRLSLDRFRAFTKGYLTSCPGMSAQELELLPLASKIMTIECGARFLTDHLDGDHYFSKMCIRDRPTISNAGHAFVPGQGQITNTCMDYYTSDGWVRYDKGETHWLVYSQDAPMLTFGQPNCFARLKELPKHMERPLFMLYDNRCV